jgi:hypothetical protein
MQRVLVETPEGNRPLTRSKRRWEGNIKMYLKETGSRGKHQFHPADKKEKYRVMNIEIQYNGVNLR